MATHGYQRNAKVPAWHGCHAARRGLATNLRALHVPAEVIQRILRHENVATTVGHSILTSDEEMLSAMNTLEIHLRNGLSNRPPIGHLAA